jgi:hypothetical protein
MSEVVWVSDFVVFEDYSVQCKQALKDKAVQFLQEVGMEIQSLAIRNTVRKSGETAGSWDCKLDAGGLAVHVGSNYDNAVYEEFGTGEYSEKGGRSGWWVYIEGSSGSGSGGKTYGSLKEAMKAVRFLREKGLPAHCTKGKHARHPLKRAFDSSKGKIIKQAERVFGSL